MNHLKIIIILLLLSCELKIIFNSSIFYPNTIYSSSLDDDIDEDYNDDYDDNNDNTYSSINNDDIFNKNKRRSIRPHSIDPDTLHEYLYDFKTNVLNGSKISTIKNKNFTWTSNKNRKNLNSNNNNNNVLDYNKNNSKFKTNLITDDINKKTTDWFDSVDGIQSDEPSSVSPSSININNENQTVITINNNLNDNDKQKLLNQTKLIPPYSNYETINLIKNQNNSSYMNRTETNNNIQANLNRPYYPGFINKPYYPKMESYHRQLQQQQQQQPRQLQQPIYNNNQQPYYHSYKKNDSFINVPTNNIKRDWNCQISSYNNCSMLNDPQIGPLFQHVYHNFFPYQSTIKSDWYLILNTTTIPANKIGARLITDYLPHNDALKGCLTLNFITTGNELEKIMIHQQDVDDNCIYSGSLISNNNLNNQNLIEHNVEITINLHKSDPRFFIEIYLKRLTTRQSSFALSKMNLSYNKLCLNDQSNNCFPSAYPNGGAVNNTNYNNNIIKRDQIPFEP